jgi:hypothetical protein
LRESDTIKETITNKKEKHQDENPMMILEERLELKNNSN